MRDVDRACGLEVVSSSGKPHTYSAVTIGLLAMFRFSRCLPKELHVFVGFEIGPIVVVAS